MVVPRLMPGGIISGEEYACGSIAGGPGNTCSTNLLTGAGSDCKTRETWADVVELAQRVWNVSPLQAAKRLSAEFGLANDPPRHSPYLRSGIPQPPQLVAVDAVDFMEFDLPERGFILYPVIPYQGIVEAYAPRGIGKTYVALSMALAVATGDSLFSWKAPEPKRVLYVDGEMPARGMQERLRALLKGGIGDTTLASQLFYLITPDVQQAPMPDLSTEIGQAAIDAHLQGVSLLILDNLATLCRTGKENEARSWLPVQGWLLNLRRRGISTLIIHHAGKSGDQRGTSAKEDIMDTVISLRRPAEYAMSEGARFEVHLTKARGIVGEDAKPFEANLRTIGERSFWETTPIEDVEVERLKDCLAAKMSLREIAEELGKSKSTIHRMKEKMNLKK
ncbi:RNA polymerase subunit sigma-70 [Oceanidesulfovibrio indonesiensis]|uniref:RNA polymerase subunit sigma-70 n=2 Tax=Oceanidesulfovibrio indonesiensis TaxID=54767 RepID=A0A7M3MAB1_9BACT|nr:RNA polymerase subunit sigma-70 [Oceanidesulfovibrio indonesiensis]